MLYTLAQLFFLGYILLYIVGALQKKRLNYLIAITTCDLCLALNYLFLDKFSAMSFTLVEICVLISIFVVQNYVKNQKWLIVSASAAICIDILVLILTWTDPLQLIPFVGTVVFVVGICCSNIIVSKSCNLYGSSSTMIYLFVIGSYISASIDVVLVAFIICGLVISIKDYKQKQIIKAEHQQKMANKYTARLKGQVKPKPKTTVLSGKAHGGFLQKNKKLKPAPLQEEMPETA